MSYTIISHSSSDPKEEGLAADGLALSHDQDSADDDLLEGYGLSDYEPEGTDTCDLVDEWN